MPCLLAERTSSVGAVPGLHRVYAGDGEMRRRAYTACRQGCLACICCMPELLAVTALWYPRLLLACLACLTASAHGLPLLVSLVRLPASGCVLLACLLEALGGGSRRCSLGAAPGLGCSSAAVLAAPGGSCGSWWLLPDNVLEHGTEFPQERGLYDAEQSGGEQSEAVIHGGASGGVHCSR